MRKSLALCLLACSTLAAQQATELAGKPFAVTKTWTIGGEGNWDALTVDPKAGQIFIARGSFVQVVEIETGTLVGTIGGLGDAHAIALDEMGAFGYIGDAKAGSVVVFDRRTLKVTARIPLTTSPRLLAFDAQEHLLYAVPFALPATRILHKVTSRDANGIWRADIVADPTPDWNAIRNAATPVTVIDTEKQVVIGQMLFSGPINEAKTDERGQLYLSVVARNSVLRVDSHAMATMLRDQGGSEFNFLDWRDAESSKVAQANWEGPDHPDIFLLGSACTEPKGLAVDAQHLRLFAACSNNKLTVWNMGSGDLVATLSLNSRPDALAYDASRGLLYAASGSGTLTVVRQHVTDSYSVIQELPTQAQARTLALNSVNGEVYLVTNRTGLDLTRTGLGKLQSTPIPGSFEVLVVGN